MSLPLPFWVHAAFLLFVATATYAQTLTGFAQSLILLGLIGTTQIVPLTDAVNAATVLGFFNAWTVLYWRWPVRFEPVLWPAVAASALGIVVGAVLLTWLVGTAYEFVRFLLGSGIVACAMLLWRRAAPLHAVSSPLVFTVTGGISGLMAGMFSTPGPPMVYLMYRQPMPHTRVQESLLLMFGIGSILRLLVVVPSGHFSLHSLQLAAEAIPVVLLVTTLAARRPPPVSQHVLRAIVCLLLVATGVGMIASAIAAMR
jgi:hypothetical protein